MVKQNKIIGLIGGMGPYASVYFYKLLLDKSRDLYCAKNNNDFPEILIDSIPVPDFISNTSELNTAKKMLVSRIKRMNEYGVKNIGMVCNTGHILYKDLSKISKAKFYSMIDLVVNETSKHGFRDVCVLATPTTIKSDLYGKYLTRKGVKVYYPTKKIQMLHESVIRNNIAGHSLPGDIKKLEISTKKFLKDNSLDCVILGCTELPLVFPKKHFLNVIDCMDVLADKLLEKYYN